MGKRLLHYLICLLGVASLAVADTHVQVSTGKGDSYPEDYVPPFLGNGSISTSVDYLGKQVQRKYVTFYPEVVWAGRRYPPRSAGMYADNYGAF